MLVSAKLKECVRWFIHFLGLPLIRYNCAKFHHCRICVADLREGGGGAKRTPHPYAAPKKPILNRVNGAPPSWPPTMGNPGWGGSVSQKVAFLVNNSRKTNKFKRRLEKWGRSCQRRRDNPELHLPTVLYCTGSNAHDALNAIWTPFLYVPSGRGPIR